MVLGCCGSIASASTLLRASVWMRFQCAPPSPLWKRPLAEAAKTVRESCGSTASVLTHPDPPPTLRRCQVCPRSVLVKTAPSVPA
jgi:hypothetical protein